MHNSSKWILLNLQLSFLLLASADPRISEAGVSCGNVTTSPQEIIPNFVRQMEGLSAVVGRQGWGTYEYGSNPTLYSLAQCMDDLPHTDCLLCFTEARTKLPRCLPSVAARVHLDGCFLRWDNYSFYQESVDDRVDARVCNSTSALPDNSSRLEFGDRAKEVIDNVTRTAVRSGGFAVEEWRSGVFSVYALAQCWQTVNDTGCRACLEKAAREVTGCLPGREGRGLNAGCYLRYSTVKFYNNVEVTKNDRGFFSLGVIIATVIAAFACLMLSIFGACLAYKRILRIRKERDSLGRLSSTVSKSNLNFKYETLEKATEFFKPSRKLGQGGAGSVFKGTLPDGRTIAVKRLFFNTRQWVDEFFNEVNLISGIRHKNLVQLLGCSIEGPESLLVYEYVVNKSIDHVLFGKSSTEKCSAQFLNWQQRLHIIVGTAEGLAYLHGGTETRIIHRDIKCSNVLLDENMNAKIADFGLARMFAPDKSHLSTGIAGTLGYMAPEYLVRGQLTEKADVYSFGVLLLEIVCGRKNTVFSPECGSVLQDVWTNYNSDSLPQSIDPALKDDFPVKEASDVLKIGLLCTQASASIRPSMPEVIQMLTNGDYVIPLPMQPPFLNTSRVNRDTSTLSMSASAKAMDTTSKSFGVSSTQSTSTTIEISETR